MKKITVTVIEDHQLIREMWIKLFSGNAIYEVTGNCGSLEEVEGLIKSKKPDITILDINLGNKSGIDAVPIIRKNSPGTRIIVVSMRNEPVYTKKMLKLGAMAYVTKNSPQEEIFKAMEEVMAGRTYICNEIKSLFTAQALMDHEEHDTRHLSMREIEIVKYIKEGLSSKEIAGHLFISSRTVEVHRQSILKKLKFKNTASLINFINNTDMNFI